MGGVPQQLMGFPTRNDQHLGCEMGVPLFKETSTHVYMSLPRHCWSNCMFPTSVQCPSGNTWKNAKEEEKPPGPNRCLCESKHQSSWWFQPMGIFPNFWGENKTYSKQPPWILAIINIINISNITVSNFWPGLHFESTFKMNNELFSGKVALNLFLKNLLFDYHQIMFIHRSNLFIWSN